MIDFEIPGAPPLLLNARLHWRSVHRQRGQWKSWVSTALLGRIPPEPFNHALVVYTRYCGYQEPDYDNLVSSWKWIQDAMVEVGLLGEDRRSNIEPMYLWEKATPKQKRVRIQVQPILGRNGTPPPSQTS